MLRTTVNGAAKRDLFYASRVSLKRMMDAYCSFGLFLKACFATTNPAVVVVCCLLLVVVCGGGSFVRLFVCSFFMCFCVVGTVCCAVVSLRRVVSCCVVVFVFGAFVVVCRRLFVSDVKFLDLLKNELPRKHLPMLCSLINNGGDRRRSHTVVVFTIRPPTGDWGLWLHHSLSTL